jgi:hypothetical protein
VVFFAILPSFKYTYRIALHVESFNPCSFATSFMF